MKVLYVGKYPPLQGGIATTAYWRIRRMAALGHRISVITIRADEAAVSYCSPAPVPSEGVYVEYVMGKPAWHIPYSHLYAERLVAKALAKSEECDFDLVEAGYLMPFAFAAWIVAKHIGRPLLLRHGGSDVKKFARDPFLRTLFATMLKDAAYVVTYTDRYDFWRREMGVEPEKLLMTRRYWPPTAFGPGTSMYRNPKKVVFFGKITAKWRERGFAELARALATCGDGWVLHCYAQGDGLGVFTSFWRENCPQVRLEIEPFVAPDRVPDLMRQVTYLFCGGTPQDLYESSNIILEGLLSGCKLLIGGPEYPVDLPFWANTVALLLDPQTTGKEIASLGDLSVGLEVLDGERAAYEREMDIIYGKCAMKGTY
jgi:glycosyltransferase involved in cell wall biosynthesis